MRIFITILSLVAALSSVQGQVSFNLSAPAEPIVAGEAFLVQYVLKGGDKNSMIQTPDFDNFRIKSGPDIYPGTEGSRSVKNFVFTLEAINPGTYFLPPAQILNDGVIINCKGAWVKVVAKQDAVQQRDKKGNIISSDYFLRHGEDPYKKIRENLFLKVQIDKQRCYVGEPVLAVFKLYSRLESKSDIIKNPGFYGFTVYDMVNLADNEITTENINGRLFDVHTIRKVQLFPLQPGRYTIDAMEVKNKVEFSRSAINKKTEQQIAEGMLTGDEDFEAAEGTEVFESSASTAPVEVVVKALPEKARPELFNGAVGKFSVKALVRNNQLAKNEQGYFEITLKGAGNFTQLTAPPIAWPQGIEGFEPTVHDELDKGTAPLSGERTFRFPFVCTAPGIYTIPAVSFSFFDRDSNSYKTIRSGEIKVEVSNEEKKVTYEDNSGKSLAEQNEKAARTAGLIAIAGVIVILIYWIFIRKEKKEEAKLADHKPLLPSPGELLKPVYEASLADDKAFYQALLSATWTFAMQRFGLSGSAMNKQLLSQKLDALTGNTELSVQLQEVLAICEAGRFTNAELENSREDLLQKTKEIFEKADAALL